MIFWLCILAVGFLLVANAVTFWRAPGTLWQRLAACGGGSLTLLAGVWGTILTLALDGLDALGAITGDPQFGQLAEAVKDAVPAQYRPWAPVVALAATMLARLRTLKAA